MTTALNHPHRDWLSRLTLLVAGGAAALSVVAITSDDVGTTAPAPTPAPVSASAHNGAPVNVPVYERMPSGWPATEVMRRQAEAQDRWRHDAELMPPGWPATEIMRQAATE